MANSLMDPIGKLMGLRYKSHPWHGVDIGDMAPEVLTAYIEMVPTDTVKYEADKKSGYLKLDRPQKYSNTVPALYGFIPQTYSGEEVAKFANEKTNRDDIVGDSDPIDICVLTEKDITHGDILVSSRPIGGFRMIDGDEADDKIIAVLDDDVVYGKIQCIQDLDPLIVERLKHYFLTYKDLPGREAAVSISHTYDAKEAHEIIKRAMMDYHNKFEALSTILSGY